MKTNENLPSIVDFFFEEVQVRTILNTETGEVSLCLSDLLKAQGSSTHPSQILTEMEDIFGDGVKIVYPIPDALGRIQDTIFISQDASAFLISRGRTERSRRLNKWLFTEVIPSIRKTGSYTLKDGPHRKAFDATIAKRHSLGMKTIRESIKIGRDLGVDLYEARVNAVHEGTKISGIDFSHYIPLIPREEQNRKGNHKDSIAQEGQRPSMVREFFDAIRELPWKDSESCLERREDQLFLRMPLVIKALRQNGHKFNPDKLYPELKKSPFFIESNKNTRCYLGSTKSKALRCWVFDPSALDAGEVDHE